MAGTLRPMEVGLFAAYAGTVAVLTLTPGPSTMLGSAHGMTYGARGTLPTIAGDLSANVLQMAAAGAGLGAIVTRSESVFLVIKWLGVLYLAWLGIGYLRRASAPLDEVAERPGRSRVARYAQGFVTSASNPKAVVFFAALFPQFIDYGASVPLQILVLGSAFLVIDGLSVLLYAATAGRLSTWLTERGRLRTQRRITGWVLIGAAGLLSLKSAPSGPE